MLCWSWRGAALFPRFKPRGSLQRNIEHTGRGKSDATRCPGVRVTVGRSPAGIYVPTLNLAATDAVSPDTPHAGIAMQRAALPGVWGEQPHI